MSRYSSPMPDGFDHAPRPAPTTLKRRIAAGLRQLGLLGAVEPLYARWRRRGAATGSDGANSPAPALVFETQGHVDIEQFHQSGTACARALNTTLSGLLDRPAQRVLDWGCGPGRLARPWRALAPQTHLVGVDIARGGLSHLRAVAPEIGVAQIGMAARLPFLNDTFDLAYGVSVLTHLSVAAQRAWVSELCRVVRAEGLIALSVHGDGALETVGLTQSEWRAYHAGSIVVRAQVKEGSRLFQAFHSEAAMRGLLAGRDIVRFEPRSLAVGGWHDLWVLRGSRSAATV
ncbi:MAG: class I SAM-dependent methyltransferase [Maricaulaceae bacterium]